MESAAEKYQKQLLEQSKYKYMKYENRTFSENTTNAYLETPRHLFVRQYREWGTKQWHEVSDDNIEEHLARLYADNPLILFGDDDENIPSTISQPSFVLLMLDMLKIEPGHKVLELGAGSGWNAALIGRIVGPEGYVNSLEIIPEVAQRAIDSINRLSIKNVNIIEADGGEGYAADAPYDRAIFTAGAYDLPHHYFEQMKDNSMLLIVIKIEGGGDTLFILRKKDDHFESIESMPCGFVQMKGKYQIENLEPVNLEKIPEWSELKNKEISKRPFWWSGKGNEDIIWNTLGVRSFLSITEPLFLAFKAERTGERSNEEQFFGLWDKDNGSLVIARQDYLISYGNFAAEKRLLHDVRQWVDLGMPIAACFDLKIYPASHTLTAGNNQWIVKRNESQFLWGLNI
jgi:protein-L-isoaspartate(D-aspartate) O-methyltransferase